MLSPELLWRRSLVVNIRNLDDGFDNFIKKMDFHLEYWIGLVTMEPFLWIFHILNYDIDMG